MASLRTTVVLLIGLFALAPASSAAERMLFTLASSPPGVELLVREARGIQLAQSLQAAATWKLQPGDPVRAEPRPPDRVIELYTGTLQAPSLLCRVLLRYYAGRAGWTPHFRLEQEPLLAKVNGRWQPFELIRGAAGALVQHGSVLPNAEGFFPTLEFGLSAGLLPIVAWQVR